MRKNHNTRSRTVVEGKLFWTKVIKERVGVEEAKALLQVEIRSRSSAIVDECWEYPEFIGIFAWDSTPQGNKYWSEVNNKIEEVRR